MKTIIIDGELLAKNPQDYIKKQFNFPDYYGENLDALYDCLTEICNEIKIVLKNTHLIDQDIIDTFKDAQEVNLDLNLKIE